LSLFRPQAARTGLRRAQNKAGEKLRGAGCAARLEVWIGIGGLMACTYAFDDAKSGMGRRWEVSGRGLA